MSSRHVPALALAAALALPASAAAEPAPGPAAWLYQPDQVAAISLQVPAQSLSELEAVPDEYVPATFSIAAGANSAGPIEVGLRLKGESSFRPITQKAAFKVKFDEYVDGQTLSGLKKMTLNNMIQDNSLAHETLAFEAARAVGVPAPRTGYARLTLNGEDRGLYLDLETLDKISLARWFASTKHLYEGGSGADVRQGDVQKFDADEGKGKDRADLEALAAAAATESGDWSDAVAPFADLEEMATMWAVERYVGQWDGYAGQRAGDPNNYYLQSEESGLFRMIPWGMDQAFRRRVGFEDEGAYLFERCLADRSCAVLYRSALRRVGDAVASLDLSAHSERLQEMIAPIQAVEPFGESTPQRFATSQVELRQFLAARPGELAEYLGDPPQPTPLDPAPVDDTTAPASAVPAAAYRAGSIGRTRALRAAIGTSAQLFAAGAIEQRGTARIGGRLRTVCFTRQESGAAAPLELRCALSSPAQRRLLSGPLTVRIATCFLPAAAASSCEPAKTVRLARVMRPSAP